MVQIDPMATVYASQSGYHYSGNNPVLLNDPSGAYYNEGFLTPQEFVSQQEEASLAEVYEALGMGNIYADRVNTANYMANVRNQQNAQYARYKSASGYVQTSGGDWVQKSDLTKYKYVIDGGKSTFDFSTQTRNLVYKLVQTQGGLQDQEEWESSKWNEWSFRVLHSANDSFKWDSFLETEKAGNHFTQTAVIIIYNTNEKDWGTPKYGQVMEEISRTREFANNAGGFTTPIDVPYEPSEFMKDFIKGAKNYHCGGCLTPQSLIHDYFDFILSPIPNFKDKLGNPVNETIFGQPIPRSPRLKDVSGRHY